MRLISQTIGDILGMEVSALIGANIADEVSRDHFCEATIGIIICRLRLMQKMKENLTLTQVLLLHTHCIVYFCVSRILRLVVFF